MCGLAGAIGTITPQIVSAVRALTAHQAHRGPDDEGFWTSAAGQQRDSNSGVAGAAFGFRRLAIIDLSPGGHQPMIDPTTGNVIIFNGEIYNHRELRRELERWGARFVSATDTEVILHAWRRWGKECVHHLRGMFALALWDHHTRCVMLARDRLGIKPLYLARIKQTGAMLFASELRALRSALEGFQTLRLNPGAVAGFVWNGFVHGPQTILSDIDMLPAGCTLTIDPATGTCQQNRYWELPHARVDEDGSAVERLGAALGSAVLQHMVSDVPLGVFLSGGIDSSAMAALAVRHTSAPVQTFTIGFDESQFDESVHARAVAQALGTDHHEVRLDATTFRTQLPDALEALDQPTFDAINTYFVSRAVRQAGITVALAGTGGDELFGGYRSFIDLPRALRMSRVGQFAPNRLMAAVGSALAGGGLVATESVRPQTRWGKLADVLSAGGNLVDLYQTSYALFTSDFAGQLLQVETAGQVRRGLSLQRHRELSRLVARNPMLHAISMLELSSFIGERLLRDTDAASMAVSLEARVPLLDHQVIEALAAVSPRRRFAPLGAKQLLRDLALGDLDPKLFDRPKSGFVLPIDLWCRRELKPQLDSVFHDRDLCESVGLAPAAVAKLWRSYQAGVPGLYWSRVWAIFVLLWWCRRHRVAM